MQGKHCIASANVLFKFDVQKLWAFNLLDRTSTRRPLFNHLKRLYVEAWEIELFKKCALSIAIFSFAFHYSDISVCSERSHATSNTSYYVFDDDKLVLFHDVFPRKFCGCSHSYSDHPTSTLIFNYIPPYLYITV